MMTSKSQSSCEKDQIIAWPIIHLFCPGHIVSLHNFMQIKCKLTSNLVLPAIQTIWQMRLIQSICRIVSFFHNINYSMLLQVMEFIPPTRISSTGSTHRKKSESFLRSAEWKQGKDGSTTERLLLYCLLYFQNN